MAKKKMTPKNLKWKFTERDADYFLNTWAAKGRYDFSEYRITKYRGNKFRLHLKTAERIRSDDRSFFTCTLRCAKAFAFEIEKEEYAFHMDYKHVNEGI